MLLPALPGEIWIMICSYLSLKDKQNIANSDFILHRHNRCLTNNCCLYRIIITCYQDSIYKKYPFIKHINNVYYQLDNINTRVNLMIHYTKIFYEVSNLHYNTWNYQEYIDKLSESLTSNNQRKMKTIFNYLYRYLSFGTQRKPILFDEVNTLIDLLKNNSIQN